MMLHEVRVPCSVYLIFQSASYIQARCETTPYRMQYHCNITYTVNAEILACRKFGDSVRNPVGLNIGEFLIWRLHALHIGQHQ